MSSKKLLLLALLLIGTFASPTPFTSSANIAAKAPTQKRDISLSGFVAREKNGRNFRLLSDDEVRVEKRATADIGAVTNFTGETPEPVRGALGTPFLHPSNLEIDAQNPDNLSPPTTDAGTVPNLKWSFSLSHTRLLNGGWVREQTITDLPLSQDFAAAELSLAPYAYRELHWHRVVEWAIVLNGTGRIAAVDTNGSNYLSDVGTGDIWYFPQSVPHSIQALGDGLEFLVLFGDGNFDSQGTTFMVTDWLAHVPKEVLAHNLGINFSDFANLHQKDPYIIQATAQPGNLTSEEVTYPDGTIPNPFVYKLSQQPVEEKKGGWVKITDSSNFAIHVISGQGRITAFAGNSAARTFDIRGGDSGIIPNSYGHHVENVGTEPLVFLEIFKSPRFSDFSLTQWLALTPHRVVADTLNVTLAIAEGLVKDKQTIMARS